MGANTAGTAGARHPTVQRHSVAPRLRRSCSNLHALNMPLPLCLLPRCLSSGGDVREERPTVRISLAQISRFHCRHMFHASCSGTELTAREGEATSAPAPSCLAGTRRGRSSRRKRPVIEEPSTAERAHTVRASAPRTRVRCCVQAAASRRQCQSGKQWQVPRLGASRTSSVASVARGRARVVRGHGAAAKSVSRRGLSVRTSRVAECGAGEQSRGNWQVPPAATPTAQERYGRARPNAQCARP